MSIDTEPVPTKPGNINKNSSQKPATKTKEVSEGVIKLQVSTFGQNQEYESDQKYTYRQHMDTRDQDINESDDRRN